MSLEMTREMGLVMEADPGRHLCDGLAVEEALSRSIDATREQVPVGRDPEPARETPHELRRRRVDDPTGFGERHPLDEVPVEQVPELGRHLVIGPVHGVVPLAEVPPEPAADAGERGLGRERLVGVPEDPVERAKLSHERRIFDARIVDRPSDQAFA